ncbi:MAG: MBL fold metallo-hydrolase [Rhodobacteraceae bacterium]|nr:MBL fold metallo-hydrolase [Paracoccaceae bacterium]
MKTAIACAMALTAAGCLVAEAAQAETRVVILGTGTPVPDAERSGPSMAVIHDGEAYVFDAGDGMVQRAIEAWQEKGIDGLYPTKIKYLFVSHLHSDHTLDYPALAATYWWRRDAKLQAYGPVGLQAMTDGYYAMQATDIHLRTSGNQPVKDPSMYQVDVREIGADGVILENDGVTVEAFTVNHGDIKPAYGYKITTPDKTVVFSGDTTYSETLIEKAKGADVLVHEVISEEGWKALPPNWQAYHHSAHTLTSELADIANQTQPGVLVLTHILHYGAPIETAKTEIEAAYDGKVVLANDLDEF